jgi:hypothetical protein
MSLTDLDRFKAACAYPGNLDEEAVERELTQFLQALGMRQRVVRLRTAWRSDPPRNRNVSWISVESIKRQLGVRAFPALRAARRLRATLAGNADVAPDARGASRIRMVSPALDAFNALDAGATFGALANFDRRDTLAGACFAHALLALFALAVAILSIVSGVVEAAYLASGNLANLGDAISRVVVGAIFAGAAGILFSGFRVRCEALALGTNWRGSLWELSWTLCGPFDGLERKKPAVEACLRPLFEAFVCGCWRLYWANDTLYWVAKPTLHREPDTQRLHHDTHAALESDIVDLYFWHGVLVPAFVIRRPDLITIANINQEINAEVRRVMIERYRHGEEIHGSAAFIRDAGGECLDHDERYGTLWRRRIPGSAHIPDDEAIVMIEVVNRTREPDGRFRHHWLRVPPTMQTAREAVAWTFNMPAQQYAPEIET